MKRFGLIGFPLGHSFSKKYFTEKFQREGLTDHVYELFPLSVILELPGLLATYPDLKGLNVTIPYKRAVIPFLDETALPSGLDASNCIRIDSGKLTGYNTDVIGFEKSFAGPLQPHHQKALVLGNGGATASVVHVLNKLRIEYLIVSRQLHEGSSITYDQVNRDLVSEYHIIINTTPLGTFPDVNTCPPIPYEALTGKHYLYDLVYNPDKTLFLQKGEEKNATVKNGYEMLEIQAEESWKIWSAE